MRYFTLRSELFTLLITVLHFHFSPHPHEGAITVVQLQRKDFKISIHAPAREGDIDSQTFRDRCWTNKQSLVNSVNTQLTQMIIRGEAPDRAIAAISKQFGVGKRKAGRLVMTESAYFANEAQKDCFTDLGVERYKIVATLDQDTCDLCGDMDGQVFRMAEHQAGLTAPPFHPWCRCCTAPYFEDLEDIGERWARNPDGSTKKVPANTTFREWKQKYMGGGGTAYVDITGAWYPDATPNSHAVRDLKEYTIDGVTYVVDGHNVVLDYSAHEKEIAELLEQKVGGELFMVPRVNNPQGVSTPDYLFHSKGYDLKTLKAGAGKNTIFNRVKKAKGQAERFIIDVTASGLDSSTIDKQFERIFTQEETGFVEEIVIIRENNIEKIVKKLKKEG